jgi:hypothetical protein
MSTDYIHVTPEDPTLIPGDERRQAALSYFRSIAPEADQIRVAVSDRPRFILCYENFEKVSCPSCGTEIANEVWSKWMLKEFNTGALQL